MLGVTWFSWSARLLLLLLVGIQLCAYPAASQCGPGAQDRQDKLALYKVILRTYWSRARFPRHYPEWRPPAQFGKLVGHFEMPVFKVVAHDRVVRKLVTASTLTELVDKAKLKLILEGDNFKVVLEADGTEVDDDDVLVEYAAANKNTTNLMILEEDQVWTSEESAALNETLAINSCEVIYGNTQGNTPLHTRPATAIADTSRVHLSLWDKFSINLIESCKALKKPEPGAKGLMIQTIVDYMMHDIKDTRRQTADAIARQIVEKYPNSFQDTINGNVVGSGYDSLKASIYNAIMYKKDLTPKRRSTLEEKSDEESDDTAECPVPRKHDEYGCIHYQPLLPQGETQESQEEKRLKLSQFYQTQDENDKAECLTLMEETYPAQRAAITLKKRNLAQLFKNWPYLGRSTFLVAHANKLLGKCIKEEWDAALLNKAKMIVNYFKSTYKKQVKKVKSSDKEPSPMVKMAMTGLKLIDEANAATTVERNIVPKIAVIFPLLANYFKEDEKFLFRIFRDEDDEALKQETGPFPTLIIKGQSLYDGEAQHRILIENSVFVTADSCLDGFLVLVAVYFVFGYQYAPEMSKTLEFLQRVLLKINPSTGSKQSGKKRKMTHYDPKVFKLATAIEDFEAEIAEMSV